MPVLLRIVVGVLVLAHGLVHLRYLVDNPDDPRFAFSLNSSWLFPASIRRQGAVVLMALVVLGYALLALAVWGVPGVATIWAPLALAASVVSIVLLAAFWNNQLVFGVVLDLALIAVAMLRPEWVDRIV